MCAERIRPALIFLTLPQKPAAAGVSTVPLGDTALDKSGLSEAVYLDQKLQVGSPPGGEAGALVFPEGAGMSLATSHAGT